MADDAAATRGLTVVLHPAYADLVDHLSAGNVAAAQRHWRSHQQAVGRILTHHYGRKTVCG